MIGWKRYPVRTNMKTLSQVLVSQFFDKKWIEINSSRLTWFRLYPLYNPFGTDWIKLFYWNVNLANLTIMVCCSSSCVFVWNLFNFHLSGFYFFFFMSPLLNFLNFKIRTFLNFQNFFSQNEKIDFQMTIIWENQILARWWFGSTHMIGLTHGADESDMIHR